MRQHYANWVGYIHGLGNMMSLQHNQHITIITTEKVITQHIVVERSCLLLFDNYGETT